MPKPKENSNLTELLKGGLFGAITFIILTVMVCWLLLKMNLSKETYFVILMFISSLSGVLSGFASVRKKRENGIVNGLISAIIPMFIMLVSMSVAYKGFSVFEMIVAACSLFGGAIGGIGAVNIKKKRKPIKKR